MIQTRDIRVDYDDMTAVSDLNLEIPAGEIFGLIGPNGAGKSSTIRVLATLQKPTYGDVTIAGMDVAEEPGKVRQILGYMPDMAPVDGDLKCWEFIDLFAGAYFTDRRTRRQQVDEALEQVNLGFKRDALAGTLSRGMKQRLVLAKTLLPDPQVLLLDEPASGLDPIARIEMRDLLREQRDRGRTILVSSHILTELSEFCGSIGIMEKGRLLVSGPIEDIVSDLQSHRRIVVEQIETPEFRDAAWFDQLEHVSGARQREGAIEFDFAGGDGQLAVLLKSLIDDGVLVKTFYERRIGVEDILLHVDAREIT